MSPVLLLAILCAISGGLMALGSLLRESRLWLALCALWLAASLPVMLFAAMPGRYVLLFYAISGGLGLALRMGGRTE